MNTTKEASDELAPPTLVLDEVVVGQPESGRGSDVFALAIATCGVGYIPIAPGTWGSAVGVALYLGLRLLVLQLLGRNAESGFIAIQLAIITLLSLIGIWAASRAERIFRKKDPGRVVIDEVAGQLIALLPVPLITRGPWRLWILIAFLLFRAFDIIKPYPLRRLESLKAGLGIVADDLGAGAYAAVLVAGIIALYPAF